MNWLYYLLEANIYLTVCYLFFVLFLQKETYYTLNRTFLLLTCVASFIFPILQASILRPSSIILHPAATLLQPAIPSPVSIPYQPVLTDVHYLTIQNAIITSYIFGVAVLLVLFIIKLYKLLKLTGVTSKADHKQYKLISINGSNAAFSFFNYLFIGSNAHETEIMIRHELVHIRQKHSFDIVFLELLKIINWFNPFVYLIQNSLKAVHEYIADEKTAEIEGQIDYSEFLVNNAYGLGGPTIAHSFFNYNLLKNRIIMLNQKRSGNLARLKYLLTLPLCAAFLCSSTLVFSKNYGLFDLAPKQITSDTTNITYGKPYVNKLGYKIAEKGYTVDGIIYFSATITDPKGESFTIYKGHGNASGEQMIYSRYGYKFPDITVTEIAGPPPPPPPMMMGDNPFNGLVAYAQNSLKYPKTAVENEVTGNVVATFSVDNARKINEVKIIQGVSKDCDEQVLDMLKSFKEPIKGKLTEYTVVISFELFGRTKDYPLQRNKVDEKILKAPNLALAMGLTEFGK